MDNFDLKKYLSNNPLLNEITVSKPGSARLFPEEYMDDLNTLTEGYLESSSPEGILDPEGEIYNEERFENYDDEDITYAAFQNIINNVPPGVYVIPNFMFGFDPAPNAPPKSFDARITITTDKAINVESAPIDEDGGAVTGWFDSNGKYHPDLKAFDEEGRNRNA